MPRVSSFAARQLLQLECGTLVPRSPTGRELGCSRAAVRRRAQLTSARAPERKHQQNAERWRAQREFVFLSILRDVLHWLPPRTPVQRHSVRRVAISSEQAFTANGRSAKFFFTVSDFVQCSSHCQ